MEKIKNPDPFMALIGDVLMNPTFKQAVLNILSEAYDKIINEYTTIKDKKEKLLFGTHSEKRQIYEELHDTTLNSEN